VLSGLLLGPRGLVGVVLRLPLIIPGGAGVILRLIPVILGLARRLARRVVVLPAVVARGLTLVGARLVSRLFRLVAVVGGLGLGVFFLAAVALGFARSIRLLLSFLLRLAARIGSLGGGFLRLLAVLGGAVCEHLNRRVTRLNQSRVSLVQRHSFLLLTTAWRKGPGQVITPGFFCLGQSPIVTAASGCL
jgi:hypothetical protein